MMSTCLVALLPYYLMSHLKINPYSCNERRAEGVIGISKQQTRFSDPCVPDHEKLYVHIVTIGCIILGSHCKEERFSQIRTGRLELTTIGMISLFGDFD